jgi:anaerobic magnesium-protoporphyrin IX monomethyl ester cyclase
MQSRPRALYRVLLHPDRRLRHAMRWYTQMGRRVWPYEIFGFLRDPLRRNGPTVAEFWGAAQDAEETSMVVQPARAEPPLQVGHDRQQHARQPLAVAIDAAPAGDER